MKQFFFTSFILLTMLTACNDDALFDKEMYKNVVALISSDYYNTFEEVIPLSATGEEAIGYIAASVGGTHAPSKDMVIRLEEDIIELDNYNRSNYDLDESQYAKFLSSDRYEITDYKITIKAGQRSGRTMIKIRPEGLSPDSTYFVGLRAIDVSGVEINPEKKTILYQVLIKNDYATQGEDDYYSVTGTSDGIPSAGNKKMFPLTHNSIRVIAGTETFESTVEEINKKSIILEVGEDNHVTIKPYKDIEVEPIDGDPVYSNTFKLEESYGHTYNVFLLAYRYTLDGKTHEIKEELRLEIED